ncbi:MAG: FUSC family protein, partial [Rhizobacter sp.]
IFAMALPAPGPGPTAHIAWNALGAAAYIVWSLLSSAALQRAYRRLAGVDALRATARLFESRAGIVESTGADEPMQAWIGDELALAERLQSARDLVFDAPDNARSRRDTAILLQAIDLRDVLLASRLDLDLLGRDEHGRRLLERIAATLRQIARALDAAADALRDGVPPREPAPIDVSACFTGAVLPAGDPRVRLLPAIESRLQRLAADVQRVHGLLRGSEAEALPLSRDQLRLFVAPEGWPLAALRAQLSGQSPVLRHAVRMAVALGSSYYLAPLLPWTSHPHWLVLSVAVVLRGNLEQTLSRRNARVLGTMLGCLAVLLLANTSSTLVLTLVFLAAVGTAHSFVMVRYWVTAAAASVMALLQAHLVDPASAFAIGERVADTLLGAALAWAFSYVLPSWERRSLPQAIARALAALRGYARHALAVDAGAGVEPRLARRKAYDALGAVAAAVRRSSAEPKSVRLPIAEVSELLDHAQRLMAHLSVVRLTLARGGEDLARPEAAAALQAAANALRSYLDAEQEPTGAGVDPPGLDRLPEAPPQKDALPWLLRRLEVTVHDAWRVHGAARAALAKLRAATPPRAPSPTARTPS